MEYQKRAHTTINHEKKQGGNSMNTRLYPTSPKDASVMQIFGPGLIGPTIDALMTESRTPVQRAHNLFFLRVCVQREDERRVVQERLRRLLEPQFRRHHLIESERTRVLQQLTSIDPQRGQSFISALFNGARKEEVLVLIPE